MQKIKILLLGEKSNRKEIVSAYLKLATFSDISHHSHKKQIKIDNDSILVEVVEIPDNSDPETENQTIRQADGYIVVGKDIIRGALPTLKSVVVKINAIKEDEEDIPIVAVGNLRDGALSQSLLSQELSIPFFVINVVTQKNIDESFNEVCVLVLKQRKLKEALEASEASSGSNSSSSSGGFKSGFKNVLNSSWQSLKKTTSKEGKESKETKENREALSAGNSLDALSTAIDEKPESFLFHLLLEFRALACNIGSECELHFYLYDKSRHVVYTEVFSVPLSSLGLPVHDKFDKIMGAFENVSLVPQSDLAWSRHTYLLCKIVKISNVCDGAPVRKPFGFATLPLSEIIRAQRQQAGDTFIMQIHLCGKDKEFMLMPGHICKKSKFASAANDQEVAGGTSIGAPGASTKKNSSMAEQGTADGVVSIVLQLFKGDLKTIMKDKKSDMISGRIKLVNSIGSIPLKSPFHPPPHVPVPGSASVAVASLQLAASENRGLTHELYLSLLRGDFVSEDLRKGVEISIFAMKENGEPLSTARFYPSDTSYHPADSVYRSVVIAGTLHPLWHECIRISIPQSDYKKTHLLFILRDCSEKDKSKSSGLVVGCCFLQLCRRDTSTLKPVLTPDGEVQMILHRLDHTIGKLYTPRMKTLATEKEEDPQPGAKKDVIFANIMLSTKSAEGAIAKQQFSEYAVVGENSSSASSSSIPSSYSEPADAKNRPKPPARLVLSADGDNLKSKNTVPNAEYQVPQKKPGAVPPAVLPSSAKPHIPGLKNGSISARPEATDNYTDDNPPPVPERILSPPHSPTKESPPQSIPYLPPALPPRRDKPLTAPTLSAASSSSSAASGPSTDNSSAKPSSSVSTSSSTTSLSTVSASSSSSSLSSSTTSSPSTPAPQVNPIVDGLTKQQILGYDLNNLSLEVLTALLKEQNEAIERTKEKLMKKSRAEKPSLK